MNEQVITNVQAINGNDRSSQLPSQGLTLGDREKNLNAHETTIQGRMNLSMGGSALVILRGPSRMKG